MLALGIASVSTRTRGLNASGLGESLCWPWRHHAFLAIGHSADENPGIDAFGFGGVLSLSRRVMTQYV